MWIGIKDFYVLEVFLIIINALTITLLLEVHLFIFVILYSLNFLIDKIFI
jgi:hypothetical protein